MTRNLVLDAAFFAFHAHRGQFRKWAASAVPYVMHPYRVAMEVASGPECSDTLGAAAWLHDVLEDAPEPFHATLMDFFPKKVTDLVVELTNTSKKSHPDLVRAARKKMDHERLAMVSNEAKLIKLCDRLDNLKDMAGAPDDFVFLYLTETRDLLRVIGGVHPWLDKTIFRQLGRLYAECNLDRFESTT